MRYIVSPFKGTAITPWGVSWIYLAVGSEVGHTVLKAFLAVKWDWLVCGNGREYCTQECSRPRASGGSIVGHPSLPPPTWNNVGRLWAARHAESGPCCWGRVIVLPYFLLVKFSLWMRILHSHCFRWHSFLCLPKVTGKCLWHSLCHAGCSLSSVNIYFARYWHSQL